jgi:hypothetical protein
MLTSNLIKDHSRIQRDESPKHKKPSLKLRTMRLLLVSLSYCWNGEWGDSNQTLQGVHGHDN